MELQVAVEQDADAGCHAGYATDLIPQLGLDPSTRVYLCGPPPMIEACLTALMQGRLYERDIYTEKFLSAADTNQPRSPLFKRV